MSSFLFEREQVHCNCFDNSPKNGPRIFRTVSQYLNKGQNVQSKQLSGRNVSEQGKHKKKSLKKERHHSNIGSETDPKQREDQHCNIIIPDIQPAFSSYQGKKQHQIMGFEYIEQPAVAQIKKEHNKPAHSLRSQRPQPFCQPIHFDDNYKIPQNLHIQFQSEKKIIDQIEYDKRITHEFENDLREFKLNIDKIEAQKLQGPISIRKIKGEVSMKQLIMSKDHYKESQTRIRYPATQLTVPLAQNQKIQHRVVSFRSSTVSNKEKSSIRKTKGKILPKQIQSEKGSSSQCQSDKESVFLGRGFDGLTQKQESFEQIEKEGKKQKQNLQTMITQQSQIKCSQINTLTEYSNSLTSPKSQYNKGMAFGGGSSKYGVAGMSYQHIGDIRRPKLSYSSKINF